MYLDKLLCVGHSDLAAHLVHYSSLLCRGRAVARVAREVTHLIHEVYVRECGRGWSRNHAGWYINPICKAATSSIMDNIDYVNVVYIIHGSILIRDSVD